MESVAIDSITGVSTARRGLAFAVKIAGAGANDIVLGLSQRDSERISSAVSELITHRTPLPGDGDVARRDLGHRLREIEDARASGLVSTEEYERLRSRALKP